MKEIKQWISSQDEAWKNGMAVIIFTGILMAVTRAVAIMSGQDGGWRSVIELAIGATLALPLCHFLLFPLIDLIIHRKNH